MTLNEMIDLSKLSKAEFNTFFHSFHTVLIDCDGVLWIGNEPIPGSIDAIKKMKEYGKQVFFVSNNNLMSVHDYIGKFKLLTLDVRQEEIIIPGITIVQFLKQRNFRKKAYIIGSKSLINILQDEGIDCYFDEVAGVYSISELAAEISSVDSNIGAVIVDFDPNINYMKMMKCVKLLSDPSCLFIAGAVDYSTLYGNIKAIGPGGFLSMIENVSGRKATVLGKPGTEIKDVISKLHPVSPPKTLVIGDTISQDIQLGINCGFQTLLVLSGVSTLQDAEGVKPNYYLKKLGDMLDCLI